ncbi:MAG: GspH/FimT family pseudopilin [Litorivicinus sp.]
MRDSQGFTLVELLVVLGVVAIIMGFAAPSFAPIIGEQSARAAAQHLMSDMVFARGEAARHNRRVQMVPTSGDWALGWQVVRVEDNEVLRTQPALPASIDVCVASASLAGNLVFRPDGRLVRNFSGGSDALLVAWLGEAGDADNRIRRVRINMAGRPAIDVQPPGASFVDDGGNAC